MPKEKVRQFGSQTVFGRAAQPAEIAPIFVFLARDQASRKKAYDFAHLLIIYSLNVNLKFIKTNNATVTEI
jgi:hypothetical protein